MNTKLYKKKSYGSYSGMLFCVLTWACESCIKGAYPGGFALIEDVFKSFLVDHMHLLSSSGTFLVPRNQVVKV